MDEYNLVIGSLYFQLHTFSKDVQNMKVALKQKDEKIALLELQLKKAEKALSEGTKSEKGLEGDNDTGKSRISDR